MESKIQVTHHVHCIEQSKQRLQQLGQLLMKGKVQSCDIITILDRASELKEQATNIIENCQKSLIHVQNEQNEFKHKKPQNNINSAPAPKVFQIQKGQYPVDTHVPNSAEYSVVQVSGEVYSKTLNHTNIQQNCNKFFILQVLTKRKCPDQFFVFFRWGRVGVVPGEYCMIGPENQASAISRFHEKYDSKVKNNGYSQIQICFGEEIKQEICEDSIEDQIKAQTNSGPLDFKERLYNCLPKMLKDLLNMCKEMGLDTKKMPLTKINQKCVNQAYEVLQKISNQIKLQQTNKNNVMNYCGQFYSLIPHDFGFSSMSKFILDLPNKISQKIKMLKCISNAIEILKYIEQEKHLFLDQIQFSIMPSEKEAQIFHYYAKLIADQAGWSLRNVYTIEYAAEYMPSPHNTNMFINNQYYEVPAILNHGFQNPQHLTNKISAEQKAKSFSQTPKLPKGNIDYPVFLLIAKATNEKSNLPNLEKEPNVQLKAILEVILHQ